MCISQDPATAIPKGTMLAVLISMISYAILAVVSGAGALRDASGNLSDLILNSTYDLSTIHTDNTTYHYGLHNSYTVSQ